MAMGSSLVSGNTSFFLSQVAFLMDSFVHLERPEILRNLCKHRGFCFVPFLRLLCPCLSIVKAADYCTTALGAGSQTEH